MKYGNLDKEKPIQGSHEKENFNIVGIGGSAGSLDAVKKFFTNMPSETGMGFVLVQHLDPTHKSSMAELLSRYTSMRVHQVEDGMEVEPNNVYVIPPNKDMLILNNKLHLSAPTEPHGLRLPINSFLKSLAEDRKNNAIVIILSGLGFDGTDGMKSIKSEGGIVIVQDPKTTESNSMPNSAINTGLVDLILPPEKIPDELISYLKNSNKILHKLIKGEEKAEEELQTIFRLIRAQTGHDFSVYKESTMYRRIDKRTNLHQIDNLKEYTLYLKRNPKEIDHLFHELLINVTSFFRDPDAFDTIKNKIIPELLAGKSEGDTIRIWVPGCSSGEEVYSMAMILREDIDLFGKNFEVQIFGTDIDESAINTARKAIYPENIKLDVGNDRLKKFFSKKDGKYQIKKEIREMIVFAEHDVLKDPPFARLDIISCRNLLIYLKSDAQKNLLSIFNYALNMNGILILGPSESVGETQNKYFQIIDKKWKIFKSIISQELTWNQIESPVIIPSQTERTLKSEIVDLTNLANQKLLEVFTPPSVIINDLGEILYTHGKMGKYLELPPGKARLNIFDMAKSDINFKLRSAVQNVKDRKKDVVLKGFNINNGESNFINITVKPILEPEIMRNLLIVSFEDIEIIKNEENGKLKQDFDIKSDKSVVKLEQELEKTKKRLEVTIREMETSYEELKAANEELQSMNEESQSTNEELETSKEEMQSINEELTTVNSELQTKIDELILANDDMNNLLNSTEIATIFLDKDLNIRNFTPEAITIIKLIKSDIGRPISDIASNIKYKHLIEDVKEVQDKLILKEEEVQTTDGIWYLMRLTPYRTLEDMIDGVVISFIDINQRKIDEKKVQKALNYSEDIFNTVREPLLVLDTNFKVISANNSFYLTFKVNEKQTLGSNLFDLGNQQWDIPKLHNLLEKILLENTEFNDFEVEHEFPGIGAKKMILNARKINRVDIVRPLILLAIEDITKI